MNVKFFKYHGTGNDFILIDDRSEVFPLKDNSVIKHLCSRRFGIGADGLMLVREDKRGDFRMVYYNSDGNESTMCGNGGRCIVAFANRLRIIQPKTKFVAIDGCHEAEIIKPGYIRLKMIDVNKIEKGDKYYYLDTGSPHYVCFKDELDGKAIIDEARNIRYNERFKEEGINVNFVKFEEDNLFVRTYERGVEDETFSCGTGVVASAISAVIEKKSDKKIYKIRTLGGYLTVSFDANSDKNEFRNIWLEGPATYIFSGEITI